jgi:hypothetical protein
VLQGILSELSTGDIVQVYQLIEITDTQANSKELPHELQILITSYADIFATKVYFPPPRSFSHTIPLVPDARPVNIRPYRYVPLLKDEIEHQIKEMLDSGLIQHSTNPFFSSFACQEE